MSRRVVLAGLGLALALSGCEQGLGPSSSPKPPGRPDRAISSLTPQVERSAESLKLETYFARVERDLVSQGLLRTDGGGQDTPFDARILTQNFVRVALFDEYTEQAGTMVARQRASRLRRWETPVRLQLTFGDSINEDNRKTDSAALSSYARRLARASGHQIGVVRDNGNFHVLILNEDERVGYGDALRDLVPGIGDTAIRTIVGMPRSTFCLVFAFSRGDSSDYVNAIAVIRGEHPDLLRLSCIQEEVAQGLGLANDSPRARPSIFNDDEEFALLTRHDELLLSMLYDQRLRPGMVSKQAGPIAELIAHELLGES
ncbi:MAG: DUF2927 domain-containing protein [Pseudomonadota bacterium]